MTGHVFARSARTDLPVAAHASGAVITDRAGRTYLDGSGGAIVRVRDTGPPTQAAPVKLLGVTVTVFTPGVA